MKPIVRVLLGTVAVHFHVCAFAQAVDCDAVLLARTYSAISSDAFLQANWRNAFEQSSQNKLDHGLNLNVNDASDDVAAGLAGPAGSKPLIDSAEEMASIGCTLITVFLVREPCPPVPPPLSWSLPSLLKSRKSVFFSPYPASAGHAVITP